MRGTLTLKFWCNRSIRNIKIVQGHTNQLLKKITLAAKKLKNKIIKKRRSKKFYAWIISIKTHVIARASYF